MRIISYVTNKTKICKAVISVCKYKIQKKRKHAGDCWLDVIPDLQQLLIHSFFIDFCDPLRQMVVLIFCSASLVILLITNLRILLMLPLY